MKTKIRVADSPTGSARTGQSISVRSIANGITLASIRTEDDGFATLQQDGHLEPYYLLISGISGGVRMWRSDDMATVGPSSPQDWPAALRALGDGVVVPRGGPAGLETNFAGGNVTVTPGVAVIQGHPAVWRSDTAMPYVRPSAGTNTYRVVLRLHTETHPDTPGLLEMDLLLDSGLPSLTQSSTVWEMSIASLVVPPAGAMTLTDERQLIHSERHAPVFSDETTYTGDVAATVPGVDLFTDLFSVTLDLPDEIIYDIDATISTIQGPVAGSTSWVEQPGLGSSFGGTSLSLPNQVAVDASGEIYVADSGNNRLLKIDTDGTILFSQTMSSVQGVCTDPTGNIYVTLYSGSPGIYVIRSYTSALVLRWTKTLGDQPTHITTDGTHIYAVIPTLGTITKRLCADGSLVATYGGIGTGNGQFDTPTGITLLGGQLYIVDSENDRVQVMTSAGSYLRQWATNSGCLGIDNDSSAMWVTDFNSNLIRKYTITGTAGTILSLGQPAGIGINSISDIIYAMSFLDGAIHVFDEETIGAGYGEIAVRIDGVMGTYLGPGNRDGSIVNVGHGTKQGGLGVTATVHGSFKSTSGTAYFTAPKLRAMARPRR
jgi:sugar lactone lactonase YvrE